MCLTVIEAGNYWSINVLGAPIHKLFMKIKGHFKKLKRVSDQWLLVLREIKTESKMWQSWVLKFVFRSMSKHFSLLTNRRILRSIEMYAESKVIDYISLPISRLIFLPSQGIKNLFNTLYIWIQHWRQGAPELANFWLELIENVSRSTNYVIILY